MDEVRRIRQLQLTEAKGDVSPALANRSELVEEMAVECGYGGVTAGVVPPLVLPFVEVLEVPVAGVVGQGVPGSGGVLQ